MGDPSRFRSKRRFLHHLLMYHAWEREWNLESYDMKSEADTFEFSRPMGEEDRRYIVRITLSGAEIGRNPYSSMERLAVAKFENAEEAMKRERAA